MLLLVLRLFSLLNKLLHGDFALMRWLSVALCILSPVDTSLFSWGQFVGISQRGHLRERGERKNPKQSGDFPPAPSRFPLCTLFPFTLTPLFPALHLGLAI